MGAEKIKVIKINVCGQCEIIMCVCIALAYARNPLGARATLCGGNNPATVVPATYLGVLLELGCCLGDKFIK